MCKQLDFLPFQCSHCKITFCLEHRTPESHECKNGGVKDVRIPICPICQQMIQLELSKGDSPNYQVEKHILSGCKSFVVKPKPKTTNRCSVKSCRRHELIPFNCSSCTSRFCIRHRFPQDHDCKHITIRQATEIACH